MVRALESGSSSAHQTVSLELLNHSFSTFQEAFDPVRVLRAIFRLATLAPSPNAANAASMGAVRNLARQAILSIASHNAPLFLTVLNLDTVQTGSDPEERASTLKLLAFMIRKVCLYQLNVDPSQRDMSPRISRARASHLLTHRHVTPNRNRWCSLQACRVWWKQWWRVSTRVRACAEPCSRLRRSY